MLAFVFILAFSIASIASIASIVSIISIVLLLALLSLPHLQLSVSCLIAYTSIHFQRPRFLCCCRLRR